MKGLILAGGAGTRLYPATIAVNKQLLPVYDKPMIYYPLSVLMLAGIREILLITSPEYMASYQSLLGEGSEFGIKLSYVEQPRPEGLAQAFTLGAPFIGTDSAALILGDNIFFGAQLIQNLRAAASRTKGATVFCHRVADPERYGVLEFDGEGQPVRIEEKPAQPRSNMAVTGLYFFDNKAVEFAKQQKPSARGELEITDLIQKYIDIGELHVEQMGRGYAWLDTGTHDSLLEAAEFVRTIQRRQGVQIACLEEIALLQNWISPQAAQKRGEQYSSTSYGRAILQRVAEMQ